MNADGATVVVDLRAAAGSNVSVKLHGQEADEVSYSGGILSNVFRDVEPGRHSVRVYDAMGLSGTWEIEVAAPPVTPEPTATPDPTPTREESIENALAEYIPWYSDPPYPLAVAPIREIWHRDSELGHVLAQAPWTADGLGHWEDDAVYGLGHLADYDLTLARQMLAYTMERAGTVPKHPAAVDPRTNALAAQGYI